MTEKKQERSGALLPRSIFFDPRSVVREMDRMVDELRREFGSWVVPHGWHGDWVESGMRMPPIDVRDRGTELEVVAEMPGVSKDAIEINLTPETLEISAEVKGEEKEDDEGYIRRERHYTSFYRRIPMPDGVIPEKSEAEMSDGILRVRIPKQAPAAKGHKLKVK
ncbi:MAG: Hsp20/alpha crystallin family protein [Candidatus Thermoplasmatota archaeon]